MKKQCSCETAHPPHTFGGRPMQFCNGITTPPTMPKGSVVRLKHPGRNGSRGTARIIRLYEDIQGGVILDKELNGFRSWNTDSLVLVTPKTKRRNA